MRPGYKQTEVGIIPEDWDVRPLGQLVNSVEYGSSAKSSSAGKVPVLRMGNLQEGKIDWNDLVFSDDEIEIAKYSLNPGDVLFNRTNTVELVGKAAIYEGERPAIFAGYLIRVKEKKYLLCSRYLNYFLNSELAKRHGLTVLSVAVGQANINGQKLKAYPVPLPPTVDEQRSIAVALFDLDKYINGLDRLIFKKRNIQQAAMQQLLTGKRRLPGFIGKWNAKRLGEIVACRSERVDPRLAGRQEFCVELEHIEPRTGRLIGQTVADGSSSLKTVFKAKDVLFGKLRAYQRKYWLAERDGVCSTEIWAFFCDPSVLQPEFLYHYVRVDSFIEVTSAAYGTRMPRSDWKMVKQFEILLPTLEEQAAIATILSDMDAELASLEARRDKARQLKQGMMQELLTGRIRMIDKEPV